MRRVISQGPRQHSNIQISLSAACDYRQQLQSELLSVAWMLEFPGNFIVALEGAEVTVSLRALYLSPNFTNVTNLTFSNYCNALQSPAHCSMVYST